MKYLKYITLFLLLTNLSFADWQASWIGVGSGQAAADIKILTARYQAVGKADQHVDLLGKIEAQIKGGNHVISATNEYAGKDPLHGTEKTLEIEYSLNGVAKKLSLKEDHEVDLRTGLAPAKAGGNDGANQWICYRKTITLDQPTQSADSALAKISADSKYWLWINGKLIVFEGQLKRGPNPNDTYYDVVDLKPHLVEGENTIAALLWYFGKHGFSHKSSGKAGFLFDAEIDGSKLLSDASWKAAKHPAYGNTAAPLPNFRLPESNIRFDAGKDISGWQNPGFDDAAWAAAAELGKAPCAPWNALVERPVPLWKDFGLKDYSNAAELPQVSDGSVIKAKLPYNAQVTPYLKIEGPAGKQVDIRMDNYQGGGPPNVRAEYITREGGQEYESLGWMNGHEMHYTIPAGFKILALKYRETGYNCEFTGTFECNDEFLNRYRQKALRTLYITMRDTYMDCPDRERAQWWGDMVNEMGEAFYALDTRANGLAKKGILELANWQRPDHTIYSPIPAGNWDRELPMQMLNSVGYFGFWTYYLYSGDLETIRAVYPKVRNYLSIWKLGKDGLVVPRKGGWTWGDWGNNKDMTMLYNGWYYLALKGQLNMAEALGEAGDLAEIKSKMASIEANFNKTFWNGKEYRSPGYKGQTDDRAHALAVVSGLAKADQYSAIREVFKTQEHSSPYMEKYVGEALYMMGLEDDAIIRTKKRFKAMTDHPYSTLWEGWGIGNKGYGGGTINHAWCGGALTLLSQYGAGVAPLTPGYGIYQIAPQMGTLLTHIKTNVPSVKGNIHIELKRDAQSLSLDLDSPADTTAIICLPKNSTGNEAKITTVLADGKTIWQQGKTQNLPAGLSFIEETKQSLNFSAQPGRHSLRVEYGE